MSGCGEWKRRCDERKLAISRLRGGRRPTTTTHYIRIFGVAPFELFKGRGGLRRKNAQVPEDAQDPIVKTILVMGFRTNYRTSTL